MTNQEIINFLDQVRKMLLDDKSWLESTIQPINEAFNRAISALQAQEIRDLLPVSPLLDKKKKKRKREKISALQAQEAKNSTESSLTQKGLDTISRQAVIDAIEKNAYRHTYLDQIIDIVSELPPAQPEPLVKESRPLVKDLVKDTISRQAAIDALMEIMDRPNHADFLYTDEICKTLNELPSAQPETGYWISARDEDGRHMWLICSECRAKETNLKAKYCPVCGRKMA